MKYSYRIESIHIPATAGMAGAGDKLQDLDGRRIVHVLDTKPGGMAGMTLTVLTEQSA